MAIASGNTQTLPLADGEGNTVEDRLGAEGFAYVYELNHQGYPEESVGVCPYFFTDYSGDTFSAYVILPAPVISTAGRNPSHNASEYAFLHQWLTTFNICAIIEDADEVKCHSP
jgi:hypothetical protein